MNTLEEVDLRVWEVQVSAKRINKPTRYYSANKSYNVAAPNIKQAIRAVDLMLNDDETVAEYWIVSVSHRGPVHGIVRKNDE